MILTLTLAYAVQTLFAVFERSDPTINENVLPDFYSSDFGLDFRESNMRFAISYYALGPNYSIESKNDPSKVSLIFNLLD